MSIVEVANLHKKFKNFAAIKNLSLAVNKGEIFGIIGPDGAGKTTFLRILAGVIAPDAGTIESCGVDVVKDPEAMKDKIGVMPQNFSLYPDLTIEENLKFFGRMYGVPKAEFETRKERLLRITNLAPFSKRRAEHLSGGMQKKLALISSLLHTPLLLLLDEPTTGVDPVSRRELWDFFYDLLKAGTTIIVSTPYMDEAERCSRVGFIYQGEMLLVDEPTKMKNNYPYNIFEISGPQREHIDVTRFPESFRVIDFYAVGDTLHLVCDQCAVDQVQRFLLDQKGRFNIKNIEPSFEDVFIALISKK